MLIHLYCLAVRHATVNRYLRDCQSSSSSSSSSSTRSSARASTTNTAVVAAADATTGARRSGRKSSSRLGCSADTADYGVGRSGSAWGGGG